MITATEQPHPPVIGETVRDIKSGKIGVVKGNEGPYYQMRPLCGGREWDVNPEDIREVDPDDASRGHVAVTNRQSSGLLPPELEPARADRGHQR